MNTPRKKPNIKSPGGQARNGAGYEAELLVQRKLWNYNYSVEQTNQLSPFDLLVEKKFRVEVKSAGKYSFNKDGSMVWRIATTHNPAKYDVMVLVLPTPTGKTEIYFIPKNEMVKLNRPQGFTLKPEQVAAMSKKPYEIFGKPKQ